MSRLVVPLLLLAVTAGTAMGAPDSLRNTCAPVRAVRLAEPVTIDGQLTESVWQGDHVVSDFKQRDPVEGAVPSFRTDVRVAYDDDALYIGARMHDSRPDSILKRLSRRDVSVPADRFAVYLDPFHDKRTGYYFLVNCAGTLFDGTLSNDGWEDASWDGVWHAHAALDGQGWTAEMRIPYSQLRFQKADQLVWGINFRRVIQRYNEENFLVYMPKNESGFVSRFPDLVGIESVAPGRSIEIMPYVTTKASYLRHATSDPFNDGTDYKPDVGGDLRMGVGGKLTLNVTANPDFGQVEVDPAVVNLSDVESFFQEKRPFFVEGSSNFSFGQQGASDYWGFNFPHPTFFYSRRIGRAPQAGILGDADYDDAPVGTSIMGAAKLTGQLAPSWNFGTLHAVTDRERANLDFGGTRSRHEVEPITYYEVTRLQKEFSQRRHGLGFMNTLAARTFDDARLEDDVNSQSLMTGLDGWTFLDSKQTWVVSGWSAMSHVRGTATRMNSLQQNSLHYFQRPDADHVEVDPAARSLTGYGSRYWLNKQKGRTIMNAALGFMTPDFDVNDVGFQSRADVINGHLGVGRKWTEPTRHRKYQDVIGALFGSADFQGNVTWAGVWGGGFTEFSNNYSFEYKMALNPETVNTRSTRGGPRMINKPGVELYTYIDTDGKSKLFYYAEFYGYTQPAADSWNWSLSPGVEWKPVSNVLLRVGPSLTRVRESAQFVDVLDDPLATATYGQRYVFGDLDQTQVSMDVRLNWAFTPTLSLQTYIQPLISTGEYLGYKALARPKSYEFMPFAYGGNADFDFKSLRGNAVLRWEYLPGSTLYLVWTQERSVDDGAGEFRLGPASRRLVDLPADNIFLAKVTYYLSS